MFPLAPVKSLGASDSGGLSSGRTFGRRGDTDGTAGQTVMVDDSGGDKNKEGDDKKMSQEILVMEPILRFLQLQCENHNLELQVGCIDFSD